MVIRPATLVAVAGADSELGSRGLADCLEEAQSSGPEPTPSTRTERGSTEGLLEAGATR